MTPRPTVELRIDPRPVESIICIDTVGPDEQRFVLITTHTPTGIAYHYVEPDAALAIARNLIDAANNTKTPPTEPIIGVS